MALAHLEAAPSGEGVKELEADNASLRASLAEFKGDYGKLVDLEGQAQARVAALEAERDRLREALEVKDNALEEAFGNPRHHPPTRSQGGRGYLRSRRSFDDWRDSRKPVNKESNREADRSLAVPAGSGENQRGNHGNEKV